MKKSIGLLFLALIFSISFVSAYGYLPSVRAGMDSIIRALVDIFEPILSALFGGYGWTSTLLFERFLIFILLVVVINLILGKIELTKDFPAVRWIIAIIVPLIGMRFIDYASLLSLINQYMVLAIILTAIVPFIIYFYFLYEVSGDHGILRKLGWLVFAGIYIGLWSTAGATSKGDIYFWTFIAALVCLLGDSIIYRRYRYLQLSKGDKTIKELEIAKINKDIQDTHALIRSGALSNEAGNKYIKKLMSERKWIMKQH